MFLKKVRKLRKYPTLKSASCQNLTIVQKIKITYSSGEKLTYTSIIN